MTAPTSPVITEAHEALKEMPNGAFFLLAGRDEWTDLRPNVAKITAALDLAETRADHIAKLEAEKEAGGFTGLNAVMNQKLIEANETINAIRERCENFEQMFKDTIKSRDAVELRLAAVEGERNALHANQQQHYNRCMKAVEKANAERDALRNELEGTDFLNRLSDQQVLAIHDASHKQMIARHGTPNRAIIAEVQIEELRNELEAAKKLALHARNTILKAMSAERSQASLESANSYALAFLNDLLDTRAAAQAKGE
ncbi:MAG: hypothetical protein QM647_13145 [Asticcacaulis sp.]|uniref:hypothetical protein n=1 Tax=Asticcacaulis sp. TaxID=1872648 RepID=UPI0039E5D4EA